MNRFLFLLPFTYFLKTRLKNFKNLVFHGYYEWVSALGILFFFGSYSIEESVQLFLIGYLAFITFYEIGYITNDQYSEKFESNPRARRDQNIPSHYPILWIGTRVIIFFAISWFVARNNFGLWSVFYLGLGFSFLMHNILKKNDHRVISFFSLSFFRFFAPVFLFIESPTLKLILPAILFHYSFYRTIIYMDNKGLLKMPSRKDPAFNVLLHAFGTLIMGMISFLIKDPIPVLLSAYFLILPFVNFLNELRKPLQNE